MLLEQKPQETTPQVGMPSPSEKASFRTRDQMGQSPPASQASIEWGTGLGGFGLRRGPLHSQLRESGLGFRGPEEVESHSTPLAGVHLDID